MNDNNLHIGNTLTVKQCRDILGKAADSMTDSEIVDLRDVFIVLSDLAIDSYIEKRQTK